MRFRAYVFVLCLCALDVNKMSVRIVERGKRLFFSETTEIE